jgi:hypothetical protein
VIQQQEAFNRHPGSIIQYTVSAVDMEDILLSTIAMFGMPYLPDLQTRPTRAKTIFPLLRGNGSSF